jgi:hypothetical protein
VNAPLALRALRWAYVAFILFASAQTFASAWQMHVASTHAHAHATVLVLILAGSEVLAAGAFLIEPCELVAGGFLLVIYAAAGLVASLEGDVPLRFVYYGATAAYIVYAHRFGAAPRDVSARTP